MHILINFQLYQLKDLFSKIHIKQNSILKNGKEKIAKMSNLKLIKINYIKCIK